MLYQCLPTVFDTDPTLKQHWIDVLCLLGSNPFLSFRCYDIAGKLRHMGQCDYPIESFFLFLTEHFIGLIITIVIVGFQLAMILCEIVCKLYRLGDNWSILELVKHKLFLIQL